MMLTVIIASYIWVVFFTAGIFFSSNETYKYPVGFVILMCILWPVAITTLAGKWVGKHLFGLCD